MSDRDVTPLVPGDVLVKKRRVGLVLAVDGMEVQVLTAKGTETWAKMDCRRGDPANPNAVTYGVRALEAAKTVEHEAVTALEVLRRADRMKRATITRVAHDQGTSHGLNSELDDLLERHGLDRRPTLFVRTLVAQVRTTFTGVEADRNSTWPLDGDRYAVLGRTAPHAVVDRLRVLSMDGARTSFDRLANCTCGTDTDLPTEQEMRDQWRRLNGAPNHWRLEILRWRMLYVVEARSGRGCQHQSDLSTSRAWEELMPDAEALPELPTAV